MFEEFIKQARNKLRMTQEEVADKANVKATYLSKMERGQLRTPPSEQVLIRLALALQLEPHEVVIKAGRIPIEFQTLILKDESVVRYLKGKLEENLEQEERLTEDAKYDSSDHFRDKIN
ncbi:MULTISPECIES: helix-turn-helix domain-containing protein [Paenibacillus]|uniref:helix-turn-helix domain-containing protein n=1 Tax=Paenibacillus TaxID=44249 RepID=UPI000404C337|nr:MULTISPECIES: helix-turn-helix transcriptional regulator [Paenibacillus]KGP77674.1 hypothetical protein P364_0131860 [Paenibacillus sp. MAEPY2]KGP78707.1 hypothetical protein P363_0132060 [Paenibacillus sp. MAEPY1]OZQ61325.1 transcriptional regulator [Paenibacillus taichungensis]